MKSILKRLSLYSVWAIAVPLLIFMEFEVFNGTLSELGIVEISQALILLILFLLLFFSKTNGANSLLKAMSLFPLIMFVRELDFLFDELFKGSWFITVLIILGIGVFTFYKDKSVIWNSFLVFTQQKYFEVVLFGSTVVLVFSRIFGTGKLWKVVMGDSYDRIIKTVVQEGLELFGYGIILIGFLLILKAIKNRD